MAKGDKQLMMSLTLVLVGSAFFLSGMGSQYWVQDSGANRTLHCGLWTTCQHVNGSTVCSSIAPGTSKGRDTGTEVEMPERLIIMLCESVAVSRSLPFCLCVCLRVCVCVCVLSLIHISEPTRRS